MPVLDTLSAYAVSILRRGRGRRATPGRTPEVPLELFEFEACPFCRKVREVLSELDLEYISRTSAKGSAKRASVPKQQFPFLVDPNTGAELYESEDIIDYLMETYGQGRSFLSRRLAPLNTAAAGISSIPRLRRPKTRPRAQQPAQLLVLYNYEACPYCRKVRDALCELDLDAHIKNTARGSRRRPELIDLGGKMQVPFLIDPNTDTAMYESDDIVAYLHRTYA